MKVLDASALFEYLTDSELGAAVGHCLSLNEGWIWAPHLVDAEVGHAMRSAVRAGSISPRSARQALSDLGEMRLQRVSHELLADRAWELRENLSFYDALYVALAEALVAPLVTFDERLAKAPGVRAEIELVGPA